METKVFIVEEDVHVAALYARVVRSLGAQAEVVNPVSKILNINPALINGLVLVDMRLGEGRVLAILGHVSQNAANASIALIDGVDADALANVQQQAVRWSLVVNYVLTRPNVLDSLNHAVIDHQQRQSKPVLDVNNSVVTDADAGFDESTPYFLEFSENELNDALTDNEITPWFQPIVDLTKCEVAGVEALARWQHPVIGVIPPNDFLNQIEHYGMMRKLTYNVLARTLAVQQRAIKHQYTLDMSVNVQAPMLIDQDFCDKVKGLLFQFSVPASTITLEINEQQCLQVIDKLAPTMERIRELGLGIALDDLSERSQGIDELKELPITRIKIDSELVWSAVVNDESLNRLCALVSAFQGPSVTSVAEGIENRDMMAMVKMAGFTHGQGYLWAPAVPRGHLIKKIRAINAASFDYTTDDFAQDTLAGIMVSEGI